MVGTPVETAMNGATRDVGHLLVPPPRARRAPQQASVGAKTRSAAEASIASAPSYCAGRACSFLVSYAKQRGGE